MKLMSTSTLYIITFIIISLSFSVCKCMANESKSETNSERASYKLRIVPLSEPKEVKIPPPENSKEILTVTSSEAAATALAKHPQAAAAKADLEAAKGRTKSMSAPLKPRIDAEAGYIGYTEPSGANPSGSTTNSLYSYYSAGAEISQLIYDFRHTLSLVRKTMAEEESALKSLTAVQSDIVLAAKLAFYRYQQNKRLVEVYRLNLENQKAHLKMSMKRYEAGVGLPSDAVRTQAAVSEAVYNLTQARTQAELSRVELACAMGIDPRTPVEAADASESEPQFNTFEKLYEQALANRAEIQSAMADIKAAERGLEAAYSMNAPSLHARAGWTSRDRKAGLEWNYFEAGIEMAIPIFDGGERRGEIIQAKAALDRANEMYRLTCQNIIKDVAQAYLEWENAKQSLETSKNEAESAREAHRLAEGRYQAGVGILLDVLDAQNTLLRSESNAINAMSSVEQAKATIKWATGAGLEL